MGRIRLDNTKNVAVDDLVAAKKRIIVEEKKLAKMHKDLDQRMFKAYKNSGLSITLISECVVMTRVTVYRRMRTVGKVGVDPYSVE